MHPGFYGWWKSRHGRRVRRGLRPRARRRPPVGTVIGAPRARGRDGAALGRRRRRRPGGEFGVRRPLRFLAYKLELDEKQVGELARILNELKTERAQAEVDGRRTTAAFADAVGGAAFDEAKAGEGATLRVQSAERLKDAVQKALREIHAVLSDEQRQRLAYLIRTGVVTL